MRLPDYFTKGIVVSRIVPSLGETGVVFTQDDIQKIENGEIYYSSQEHPRNFPIAIGKITGGYVITTPNMERDQIGGFVSIQRTTLLLTLVIGTALMLFAVAMIVKPIKAVTEATKKVADGHFDLRLKVKGKDELATLARNFNIMTNAINHTPENGVISLLLKATPLDIAFEIKDTGEGISPEDQEKIFDRFYKGDQSRSTPGTGLGLTICQRIIDLHGGSISVESVVGAGSRFCVKLPRE